MNDMMPNDFWSGWIVVLTLVSLAWLAWLVLSVYFLPRGEEDHSHEPVWDKDLIEGKAPAPIWWFWLILAAMVFSVIYLMFYPGLGSFKGALRWTQAGQIETSRARFDDNFEGARETVLEMSISDIQSDTGLMTTARTLFTRHCAACHGYEAQGQADLFPDLRDSQWQWGGSQEQITQSIRQGRNALMTSWAAPLGDNVEPVADYVQVLGTQAAQDHPGQEAYNQFCVACHGAQGQGNPQLGAPNLSNDIWLYGGDRETIIETITEGRNGIMPAFNNRLDDVQTRLLVAWVLEHAGEE